MARQKYIPLLLVAAFFQNSSGAQTKSAARPDDDFKISSTVHMVLLDVSVKDTRGGFVSGMSQDGFQVYENGKLQSIKTFVNRDVPVTVGLIVDNSGSMRNKRAQVVTAALSFVKESSPQDEVFVVNFNDHVQMGLPAGVEFTDDLPMLRAALLSNQTVGRTALYDAMAVGLNQTEKGVQTKKTLILISDGGDNASQYKLADIIKLAQEELVTIYTIGIFTPGDPDQNPGVLKQLANLTGGEFYSVNPETPQELVDTCKRIAHDIRSRYTIGYSPENMQYDGKVRKLKVTAAAPDRGKLVVKTRASYIAQPPEKQKMLAPDPQTLVPPSAKATPPKKVEQPEEMVLDKPEKP